jgi:hypothetical protein
MDEDLDEGHRRRADLAARLKAANAALVECRHNVERQGATVQRLVRDGAKHADADQLLTRFERAFAAASAERDRIIRELKALPGD